MGRTEKPEIVRGPDDPEAEARRGERPVWDPVERALVPTPVWDGQSCRSPRRSTGAAIVELASTTIVVPRDFTLDVDAYGGFVVHSGERGAESARLLEGVGLR